MRTSNKLSSYLLTLLSFYFEVVFVICSFVFVSVDVFHVPLMCSPIVKVTLLSRCSNSLFLEGVLDLLFY